MATATYPAYTPTPPTIAPETEDARNLADWMLRELHIISQNLNQQTRLQLTPLSKPPPTPRQGLVVYSDGVSWNPLGLNRPALVVYNGTAWIEADLGIFTVSASGVMFAQGTVSGSPVLEMEQLTNDASSASILLLKTRNFTPSLNGDILGYFQAYGYANGNFQPAARIFFQQFGAVAGNNVPSAIILTTSDATGQLNHELRFDNNGFLTMPFGPIVNGLKAVATPTNANAAAAGVALNQLYTDTADPAKIYVRTV